MLSRPGSAFLDTTKQEERERERKREREGEGGEFF